MLAEQQHSALMNALCSAGVSCRILEPAPGQPFQCYTRDSSVMTPWGLFITKMGFDRRVGETHGVEEFAARNQIQIWWRMDIPSIEGGDVLLLKPGVALIGCNEVRTTKTAAARLKQRFNDGGWDAHIVNYPENFRHLDLLIGVLSSDEVVCCETVLSTELRDLLIGYGLRLHPVPEDAAFNLACNVLNLGERRILAHAGNAATNRLLERLGYQVIEVDISQFVSDSGGVHCLTQALRRDLSPQ